jgi:hypothetical protein
MAYVIYNKETTIILRAAGRSWGCYVESYKSESAAKAALTRLEKKDKLGNDYLEESITHPNGMVGTKRTKVPYTREDFAIAEDSDFRQNIEIQVERVNLMSGKPYMERINEPLCTSPSSETYWCL